MTITKRLYFPLFLLFGVLSNFSHAQTVIRSSINCIGSSNNSESIQIQQVVGQPYGTTSYFSNEIESRPGFIQPSQLWVEMTRNTFTVEVLAYPNPATSSVDFKLNENLENIQLRVIDQYGKMIYTEEIESLREYNLDCGNWTAGNYFIYLTDKSGNVYQLKLIKQ